MPLLDPFADDDLVPPVREALKRLEIARDAYQNTIASLDAQYLKPLNHTDAADQAEAVRALFTSAPHVET